MEEGIFMAMKKCDNCGNDISSEAGLCPICGAYIREKGFKNSFLRKLLRYVFIVVSVIVALSLAYVEVKYLFLYDYVSEDLFETVDVFAHEVFFQASVPLNIIIYSLLGLYLVLTEKK